MNISDDDLGRAADRARVENLRLLALRFESDRICPKERMIRLKESFRDQMDLYELPGGGLWRKLTSPPHATLTEEYDKAPDRPDEPTRVAFARVVEFLRTRLT